MGEANLEEKEPDFEYEERRPRGPRQSDRAPIFKPLEVEVKDNIEKAMKALKQKMSKEGVLQELKRRRFYEKPSVKRKRKMREALKRRRKAMRKRVYGP